MSGGVVNYIVNFFDIVYYVIIEYGFNLLVVFFSLVCYNMFVEKFLFFVR